MRVGEREQPARFLERLPRLHGDAGVEAGARHLALRLVGQEVAPERAPSQSSIQPYSAGS